MKTKIIIRLKQQLILQNEIKKVLIKNYNHQLNNLVQLKDKFQIYWETVPFIEF